MRVCFLLLLSTLSAFAADAIKIGYILPLTGDQAFLGERCEKAIKMSYDDLPVSRRGRYKLFFEDNQADNTQALLAANRLVGLEKVDALVCFGPGNSKVIAPIATRNDIIYMGISLMHEVADGRNNFTFWGLPSDASRLVAQKLKSENKNNVALLYAYTDPGVRQTRAFRAEAQKMGLQIVDAEAFYPGERDFRMLWMKVVAKKPDAVFVFAWMPEIDILIRQEKQLGLHIPLTTVEAFNFLEDRTFVEGDWYATALNPIPEFKKRFEEKFQQRGDWAESEFYDSLQLIYDACEKHLDHKPTRAEIATELLKIKNRPSQSGILTMNTMGQIIIPSYLVRVLNGRLVPQGNN